MFLYYTITIEKSMLLNEIMFNVKITKLCILHIGNINEYNMTKNNIFQKYLLKQRRMNLLIIIF